MYDYCEIILNFKGFICRCVESIQKAALLFDVISTNFVKNFCLELTKK